MGYYTYFKLDITGGATDNECQDIIERLRSESDFAFVAFDETGDTQDADTWYDCNEDMAAFSRNYPAVVFILSGRPCVPMHDGDRPWANRIQNGVVQEIEYAQVRHKARKPLRPRIRWQKVAAEGALLPETAEQWLAVLDAKNNLMWAINAEDSSGFPHPARTLMFAETPAVVQAVNLAAYAGFQDWRLPTFKELQSLRERKEQQGLYLHRAFFTDVSARHYTLWTSDVNSQPPGEVLTVRFDGDVVNDRPASRYASHFMRLVRSVATE